MTTPVTFNDHLEIEEWSTFTEDVRSFAGDQSEDLFKSLHPLTPPPRSPYHECSEENLEASFSLSPQWDSELSDYDRLSENEKERLAALEVDTEHAVPDSEQNHGQGGLLDCAGLGTSSNISLHNSHVNEEDDSRGFRKNPGNRRAQSIKRDLLDMSSLWENDYDNQCDHHQHGYQTERGESSNDPSSRIPMNQHQHMEIEKKDNQRFTVCQPLGNDDQEFSEIDEALLASLENAFGCEELRDPNVPTEKLPKQKNSVNKSNVSNQPAAISTPVTFNDHLESEEWSTFAEDVRIFAGDQSEDSFEDNSLYLLTPPPQSPSHDILVEYSETPLPSSRQWDDELSDYDRLSENEKASLASLNVETEHVESDSEPNQGQGGLLSAEQNNIHFAEETLLDAPEPSINYQYDLVHHNESPLGRMPSPYRPPASDPTLMDRGQVTENVGKNKKGNRSSANEGRKRKARNVPADKPPKQKNSVNKINVTNRPVAIPTKSVPTYTKPAAPMRPPNPPPLLSDREQELLTRLLDAEIDNKILINTKKLCSKVEDEMRDHSIGKDQFAKRILWNTEEGLSKLLHDPKPWEKLRSGRWPYRRMHNWVIQPLTTRLAFFDPRTDSSSDLPLRLPSRDGVPMELLPFLPFPLVLKRTAPASQKEPVAKRPRVRFTEHQKKALQDCFEKTERPSIGKQEDIANSLGLDISTVINYFNNRRNRKPKKIDEITSS